jgi:6-phosphogluconate dehydrogenase
MHSPSFRFIHTKEEVVDQAIIINVITSNTMQTTIGFIGLGRMGLNMAELAQERGLTLVAYNRSEEPRKEAEALGIKTVASIAEMIDALPSPKVVWLMVTSSAVDTVLEEVTSLLKEGDTVVDGGNSFYLDSLRRHKALEEKGLHFLDCGTSGGMTGARHGASIMVGGTQEVFGANEHLFKAFATEGGYARVGGPGAGHFVKMIHNGIEYGMMGALAEGFSILHDHEDTLGIDIVQVLKPYTHESIIAGKLTNWLSDAYTQGQVEAIEGVVPRGETESEMEHIITLGEAKVLEAALHQRKSTREKPSYLGRLVAAMRNQFGGHKVVTKE